MKLGARLGLVMVAMAGLGLGAAAARGAEDKAFQQQRPAIMAKLKSDVAPERAEGVGKLAAFPTPESAKLIIQFGLHDETPEVRRAAYEALLKFKNSLPVCDFLIDTLNLQAKRAKPDPNTPLFLAVLLSSSVPYIEQSSQRFIEDTVAKHKDGAAFMVTLVDLLGTHADPADIAPLRKIIKTTVFEREFGLRRATVQTLSLINDNAALDLLVDLLAKVEGEVAVDIMYYLSFVTEKKYATRELWTEWWNENRATFVFPSPLVRPTSRDFGQLAIGDTSQYYGLPLYGERVVFILDSSGSMGGGRIEAAKRELITAVRGLKDNQKFGIIVFNSRVVNWKKELVDAGTANKLDAVKFISNITAGDRTATYDALVASFYFDAEAIYLLTDGAPTDGRFVLPADIVAAITLQNRTRRVSIYTIGLAPQKVAGLVDFEEFLIQLSAKNSGAYKRVDE